MKNTLILLLILFSITNAQDKISVHQFEYERHKSLLKENFEQPQSELNIIPLNKSAENDLSKAVFGYLPYWEYATSKSYIRYDLLTHIAAFSFSVSGTGSISNPSYWPWTDVINTAHTNGVKVVMSVVNFDITKAQMHSVLVDSTLKLNFINAAKSIITTYSLDGINIDFEASSIDVADRGTVINNFMSELTDSIHALSSDLEVSYASSAVNWGGWNLTGLANSCDYLFVMGYDFYGSWSTNTGPTAPLVSNSAYNVTNTIIQEYATITSFSPDKLILGVPYYGPHWKTVNQNEGSTILSYVTAERFRDVQSQSEIYGIKWSNTFKNSWYSYLSGSTNHQVWYDNDSSLGLKYDLAIQKNLKGVGMWALGYDGSRTELWNLINYKFGNGTLNIPSIPANFSVIISAENEVTISFSPSEFATSYEVYVSENAQDFNFLQETSQTSLVIENSEINKPYYLKVRARNIAGSSQFTEVLGTLNSDQNKILIVNGFDRMQSTNNTFDYIKQHAEPLAAYNFGFSSCSNEAVYNGNINLNDFDIVFWMLLDESSTDETFNVLEQEKVIDFLKHGGKFFVSGSEIGWDLVAKGSSDDISFYNNYLKANYISDAPKNISATYYNVEAISGELFDGLNFPFDNGTHGTIDVDWPDAISALNGSTNILKFANVDVASGVAGIAYSGSFGNSFVPGKLVHFSFPYEAVYNVSDRIAIIGKVLEYFDETVSVDANEQIPTTYVLNQNYPNPFNPTTTISYVIPDLTGHAENKVKLTVYNIMGQEVAELVNEYQKAGNYNVQFNGSNLASGTYFYRFSVNDFSQTKSMSLIK